MSSDTSVGARRVGAGGSGTNPPAVGRQTPDPGSAILAPSKPTRARRRPAVIALGVALVALGILASVGLTTVLGQTRQVLAVTSDIARGEPIGAENLAVVDLPNGPTVLDWVDGDLLEEVSSQVATSDLTKGSLVTSGSYAPQLQVSQGKAIVGVALAPNQMPLGTPLRSGDQVSIVETPVAGGDAPVEKPTEIAAVVVSTSRADIGDQTVVDVEVADDDAAALAARAATGRVALVLKSVASDPGSATGEDG